MVFIYHITDPDLGNTDLLLCRIKSQIAVRKFTRTDRNWLNYWNRLLLFILPAQFLVILIEYTCTDYFQVISMIYITSLK